jgi:hypothetical protein
MARLDDDLAEEWRLRTMVTSERLRTGRARTGTIGPDTGDRRLYGAGTWHCHPGQAESGTTRDARWRQGSDA